MSRKAHDPSDEQRRMVESMAACGVPEEDIARVVAIDPKTLRKHYRNELETGHIKASAKVAQRLFQTATGETSGPQVTAAIFWLKTRAGWKETVNLNHAGADGAPLVPILNVAIGKS